LGAIGDAHCGRKTSHWLNQQRPNCQSTTTAKPVSAASGATAQCGDLHVGTLITSRRL
jgi:hypothetical protein